MVDYVNKATFDSAMNEIRDAVQQAKTAIQTDKDVNLAPIEKMVESLTQHLQEQIEQMSETDRLNIVSELTELLAGFTVLEEAITQPSEPPPAATGDAT